MTPVSIHSNFPGRSQSAIAFCDAPLAMLSMVLAASSLIFYLFPGIDLRVSGWFYDATGRFGLADSPPLRALRASSTWIMTGVLLATLFQVARSALRRRTAGQDARRAIWLVSCLLLGPGLLVNGLLKAHWGRPRPNATDLFGGEAPFQKVWVVSDWCDRNCSFVSGEASSAAWLVAAALLAPRRIRAPATALAVLYAFAISINRIAFGGHYLSDVLIAWLLCALVFAALYRLILNENAGRTSRPVSPTVVLPNPFRPGASRQ